MPLFHREHKDLNYVLHANVFPEDIAFIHGNLGSARWWQPTLDILDAERSEYMRGNALAMDWIGCGNSSAPKDLSDLHMKAMAEDHVALIRAAGLSNVNLVGHSTGALIALYALLEAPDLFAKVLLLDPVSAEGIQFGPEMLDAFTKMSKDRAFCETILMGTVYGVNTKRDFFQLLVDDAFRVHELIWHGIPKALSDVDIKSQLKKIAQPMLVLHGEHDEILPEEGARQIASSVKSGKFEKLSGRGHCANVEDPKMFVQKLHQFFC